MAAARYRDRHSVSRKKSDPGDALVLANILRTDMHAHRPLPHDSDLARAIAVLARAQQDATWNRQQMSNQLRSLLREYHPAALDAFAMWTNGLCRPEARELLKLAPTAAKAARLSRAQISAALRHRCFWRHWFVEPCMTDLVERLVPEELWVLFRRVVPPTEVKRP